MFFSKISKIPRKTPVPEPPFSKVAGIQFRKLKETQGQLFCIFFIGMSTTVIQIIKKAYIETAVLDSLATAEILGKRSVPESF